MCLFCPLTEKEKTTLRIRATTSTTDNDDHNNNNNGDDVKNNDNSQDYIKAEKGTFQS